MHSFRFASTTLSLRTLAPALALALALATVLAARPPRAFAEGAFAGLNFGVSEATNWNYRGHVKTGLSASPYVGYMFHKYLGAQGELQAVYHDADYHPERGNQNNQGTVALGFLVGPRIALPVSKLFDERVELYGTAQGGVFTGLSGRLSQTAPGFSVGGGVDVRVTPRIAVGLFGRWNRSYQSPRPTDLGPDQEESERYGQDIRWVTAGIGLKYSFAAPAAPPAAEPVAAAAEAAPAPTPRKYALRAVHFDFDRARLRKDALPILDEAVEELKGDEIAILCEGHADSSGDETYNMGLSRRRAESVRKYLVSHGIATDRIRVEAFGESRPAASNSTSEGRAQNRRVEIRVE